MLKCFIDKKFTAASRAIIDQANDIIFEYSQQGYDLTLRQLYYQFVSRDLIENTQKSYKRLGSIISDARLAGLVSWESIEDRTRNVNKPPTWESPAAIVETAANAYQEDKWRTQVYRPEIWVEKEALAGVIDQVGKEFQLSTLACRGYMSQSEMWQAAQRFKRMSRSGQVPVVLHLGDHDPSGIDMTRDNLDRLWLLSGIQIEVRRLGLNMDQVEEYSPPPNPAKLTDSRCEDYIKKFGRSSWELDALEPSVLRDLIADEVEKLRIPVAWEAAVKKEKENIARLREFTDSF